MTRWLFTCALSLSSLWARYASAAEAESTLAPAASRVVELRVSGDAAALARVRLTARELLSRLDVESSVTSIDEPEVTSTTRPLIVAYLDLRSLASPAIQIEDGTTRRELSRRQLTDVATLETAVESLLHVLYLTVESTRELAAQPPPRQRDQKPQPAPRPRAEEARPGIGLDVGPLLRVSTLGASRIVPGGGIALEPRATFGQTQVGLALSAALHASSALSFARGEATVRPLQFRVVPTVDWLFSSDVSGSVGLGAGVDSLLVEPVQPPDQGTASGPQSALDPVLTAVMGARLPISGRAFLSALGSVDYDLAPTSFVAREGALSRPILQLPRLRAGFTLALSFTVAGPRRFRSTGGDR